MKKSIATLVRSLTEENPQETDDDLSSTGGAVSTVSKVLIFFIFLLSYKIGLQQSVLLRNCLKA